jgi:hypothetical protein
MAALRAPARFEFKVLAVTTTAILGTLRQPGELVGREFPHPLFVRGQRDLRRYSAVTLALPALSVAIGVLVGAELAATVRESVAAERAEPPSRWRPLTVF